MAENLKLYYQNQLARYQTMRSEGSAELAQINDEQALAKTDHAALVKAYAEQERTIAATRKAMSMEGLMPADVAVLVDDLRQLLIDQRAARTALLTVEDQMALLERARDAVTQRTEVIDSRLTEIDMDLAEAIEQAEQHVAWALQVSDGEIADLQASVVELIGIADGGALPADPESDLVILSEAKTRIETDVPEILRDHARLRGAYLTTQLSRRLTELADLQQAVVDQQAADFGVAGLLPQAWLAYEDAEQAYVGLVGKGAMRYEQALALMSGVTMTAELTTAETDRIAAVALAVDADALVKEAARDTAQAAAAAKVVEIEDAITAAMVIDVNADPEADATVIVKRGELVGLESDLTTAVGEFDATMQTALALWQGAVPDASWANFVNYDQAVSSLRDLNAADVVALGVDLDDAETALVDALEDVDGALRLLDELEERAALLDDRMTGLNDSRGGHLVSAVRGDEGYHTSLVQGEIL
jgi:hypothetical protein